MTLNPTKYKDVIFTGSTFPDDPYRIVPVHLNDTIVNEYLPAIPPDIPHGLKLLITAMTHQEGFRKGTRAYRTNNPGNIGNTDTGANKALPTIADGIRLQADHIRGIAAGKKRAYPVGKNMILKPYYSPEIAANPQYGLPPYLPGYRFKYTGQLDQFIKIYSTGARVTNSYINVIVSYFDMNGIQISPADTLRSIINTPIQDIGEKAGEGI